jgi:hypothetical protein
VPLTQIIGWILFKEKYPASSILINPILLVSALFLADSEHFGAAGWTNTLGRRFAVLHGDGFSIAHFFLGAALHTICLHGSSFLEAI